MVKLKKFNKGDEIKTLKWNSPFIVELFHKGFVVAVNRRSKINPIFLFIKTYSNEVYYGSSRFLKYGCNTKESLIEMVEMIVRNEFILEKDYCLPPNLILTEDNFEGNERRDMIKETLGDRNER